MTTEKQRIETEIELVDKLVDQFLEGLDRQNEAEPFGLNAMSDEEHAAWYEQQVAKSPPEAFKTKEGGIIIGSPWVLMLGFTENGETETKRYMRTRGLGANG